MKRFLFYHFDDFVDKGYEFFHIDEMNIVTVNDKLYMTDDYYIKHPMPAVELKKNMIISKNPQFIKPINRSYIR